MVCIYCGSKTQVVNSRPQKRLNRTWRRRQCTQCHAVFTTEEAVDLTSSIVVRTNHKNVEPFSRDKLFTSLLRALGHRQTAVEDAGALCSTIIAKLMLAATEAAVTPSEIVIISHETLERFDTAAAIQYKAYHPLHG